MTRNEAIPLASMKAGMPWDWVSYPEFLDSVDRRPKAMNILPFVALSPLLVWVMGLDEAKTGRRFTEEEEQAVRKIVNEAMDVGRLRLVTSASGSVPAYSLTGTARRWRPTSWMKKIF